MKRIRWVAFTAQDGHSIGVDTAGRAFEISLGELTRLPDPPAEERHASVKTVRVKPAARRRKR